MPFCPKCKYEYREGFTVCPDCDLKLVPKLHEEPKPEYIDLVEVVNYMTDIEAQEAKLLLESHGIPSVIQGSTLSQTYSLATIAFGGVKILVREEHVARARKVLGKA